MMKNTKQPYPRRQNGHFQRCPDVIYVFTYIAGSALTM